MLENLVIAVESEAQVVDIGRVSGFMQKVRSCCVLLSYFLKTTICRSVMV